MVKVSILYPQRPGSRFDMDYYIGKHMPMSIRLLGSHPGYRGVCVEKGIAGAPSGSQPAYVALCHFAFESIEAFMEAFAPHAGTLQADIPRYTDVSPVIQFNEVLISQ